MIKFNQTKIHSSTINGNCLVACLASYFNLDIKKVPQFEEMNDYSSELLFWVQEQGYEIETVTLDPYINEKFNDYYFAIGKSPRNQKIYHSVIYYKGKLFHDPHPDKTGLDGDPTSFWYLNKLTDEF